MESPDLHDALESMFRCILDQISRERVAELSEACAVQPEKRFYLTQDHDWTVTERMPQRKAIELLLYNALGLEVAATKEAIAVVQALADVGAIPEEVVGSEPQRRSVALWAAGVSDLLGRYAEAVDGLDFDRSVFKELYAQYEAFLLADDVAVTEIGPLASFVFEGNTIRLSDEFSMRRLTREEINELLRFPLSEELYRAHPGAVNTVAEVFGERWAIVCSWRCRKEPLEARPAGAGDPFKRVLRALRLTCSGDPFCNISFYRPQRFGVSRGSASYQWPLTRQGNRTVLELGNADVPRLKQTWDWLVAKPNGGLDVALRKFDDVFIRQTTEDRLIDMTILLESVLLGDADGEYRYRFSLRGAWLLRDVRQPRRTYYMLRSVYDVRSKVVHTGMRAQQALDGVSSKIDLPELAQWTEEVTDICRDVLMHLLEQASAGSQPSQVIEALDQAIIDPQTAEV